MSDRIPSPSPSRYPENDKEEVRSRKLVSFLDSIRKTDSPRGESVKSAISRDLLDKLISIKKSDVAKLISHETRSKKKDPEVVINVYNSEEEELTESPPLTLDNTYENTNNGIEEDKPATELDLRLLLAKTIGDNSKLYVAKKDRTIN